MLCLHQMVEKKYTMEQLENFNKIIDELQNMKVNTDDKDKAPLILSL